METYTRLYNKKESWFNIKYSSQILFLIVFTGVVYFGYPENQGSTPEEEYEVNKNNCLRGFVAACLAFIAYNLMRPYVGPFYKPHEGVWRTVASIAVLYFMILVFLLFQNAKFARHLFWFIDSSLDKKIPRSMHTYEENCDLDWEKFLSNFDHYYLSHLGGWFVLALVIRNRAIVHSWALLDEVIELSLEHVLPYLQECWWDHIIMDILLSNTVGIELAMLLMRCTGIKQYDWLGKDGAKSWREWKVFTCHRHFGSLIAMLMLVVGRFVGMFFLMNALLLPPPHIISVVRVICWAFFAYLPFKEIYEDVRSWNTVERKYKRVEGNYRWLSIFIVLLENIISFKFRKDTDYIEDAITPWYIPTAWIVCLSSMLFFYIYLRCTNRTRKYREPTPNEIEKLKSS